MDDNKSKALAAALAQIEKQFGKGSVMRMDDSDVIQDIQSVSTGSLGLDIALGIGGLPRGRVVEIYGPALRHCTNAKAWWCGCLY
ncbi:MAG: strand exchange and recombination protein with protease and nuclease [Pseudomonadota bacterium]